MKVAPNTVIRFHYTLSDPSGTEIERSSPDKPVTALVGHRNLVAGLEQALMDQEPGATVTATLTPDQGYGERKDNLVQRVPKKYFRDPARLKPGMGTVLSTKNGPRPVTVQKVGMSVVDVDLNHPMAGRTLVFQVELLDVRAADDAEVAHGHVHGSDGHQH